MNPAWQTADGAIKLFLGDCLEILPTLEVGSVDAVVTDPPYNIGTPQRVSDMHTGGRIIGGDFGVFDEGACEPRQWMPLLAPVLSEGGLVVSFYGAKAMHSLLTACESFEVVQDFHWCKTNPPVPMRSVGFAWGVESGYVFRSKGQRHKHNNAAGISPNWIATAICNGDERGEHPTQKRLDVMDWLVDHWSFPGDIVCDPFMGSGTTGVACARLGRRFMGIEIEPRYFEIAVKRIEAELSRAPLFEPKPDIQRSLLQ